MGLGWGVTRQIMKSKFCPVLESKWKCEIIVSSSVVMGLVPESDIVDFKWFIGDFV